MKILNELFYTLERSSRIRWRSLLEERRRLLGLFSKAQLCVFGKLSKEHSLGSLHLARRIQSMYRTSGPLFTSQYLKAACAVLMWWFGGRKTSKFLMMKTRISLTRSGLPRILPVAYRKRLREGKTPLLIRFLLTLFSLAKLIVVWPSGRKFSSTTIYNPNFNLAPETKEVCETLLLHYRSLLEIYLKDKIYDIPLNLGFRFHPTWSAGPNSCVKPGLDSSYTAKELGGSRLSSWHLGPADAMAITEILPWGLWHRLVDMFAATRTCRAISNYRESIKPIPIGSENVDVLFERLRNCAHDGWTGYVRTMFEIGRLGIKLEHAGKKRIFAIANPFIQSMLRPLHDWSMSVLKLLPTDGTYNQLKPLARLKGNMKLFSYDLKAATDSMPIQLSSIILYTLFGRAFSQSWSELMQHTVFRVQTTQQILRVSRVTRVNFNVGQPLGYYSSWPIFTLTHHALVWLAAAVVYPGKQFLKYAILGDDIVIADERVAEIYSKLISGCQMTISVEKSLISDTGACEFAKQFMTDGCRVNLSPYSLKVLSMFGGHMSAVFYSAYNLSYQVSMRLRGAGYRRSSNLGVPKNSRKWLRHWLMMFSINGITPIPIDIWLTLPKGGFVNPYRLGYARGRRIASLRPNDFKDKEIDKIRIVYRQEPEVFELMMRPWVQQSLNYLDWYFNYVIKSHVPLEALFKSIPSVCHSWRRSKYERNLMVKFGPLFKLWDDYNSAFVPRPLQSKVHPKRSVRDIVNVKIFRQRV